MPEAFSGTGVEREEAVAEEIGAGAICTIEVVFGAARGTKTMPRFSSSESSPSYWRRDGFPGVAGPGVVAEFAGTRNGVKGPGERAGFYVVGANVAGRGCISFIGGGAEDEQIFEDAAGRGGLHQVDRLGIAIQATFRSTRP